MMSSTYFVTQTAKDSTKKDVMIQLKEVKFLARQLSEICVNLEKFKQ